jgi:hypothetical protein
MKNMNNYEAPKAEVIELNTSMNIMQMGGGPTSVMSGFAGTGGSVTP